MFFLLLLVLALCFKIVNIPTAAVLGILWYLVVAPKEGMNESTSLYSWFEPEGYGSAHSMINPKIKPLMYKYV